MVFVSGIGETINPSGGNRHIMWYHQKRANQCHTSHKKVKAVGKPIESLNMSFKHKKVKAHHTIKGMSAKVTNISFNGKSSLY